MTKWVTWTYDPLLRTNAIFNIHRLGAVCNLYRPEFYGMMRDELNAGTPSDRCRWIWWLDSGRVQERTGGGSTRLGPAREDRDSGAFRETRASDSGLLVWPTVRGAGGFSVPDEGDIPYVGRAVAVPLPVDIAAIRRADPGSALAWRLFMRRVLEAAFAHGYWLVDCVDLGEGGWHYLLEPRSDGMPA